MVFTNSLLKVVIFGDMFQDGKALLLLDPLALISGENLPSRLDHRFQDLKKLKISFTALTTKKT